MSSFNISCGFLNKYISSTVFDHVIYIKDQGLIVMQCIYNSIVRCSNKTFKTIHNYYNADIQELMKVKDL